MKEKIKDYVKKDWKFLLVGMCLLIITILVSTVTYRNAGQHYGLHYPTRSLYGTISWAIIIIVGVAGIMALKNVTRKSVPLQKVYLMIAIPIGILYCLVNPLGRIPDEDHHARKAMAISNGNIFSEADENGDAIDSMNSKLNELVTRSTDDYEDYWRRLTLAETEDEVDLWYTTMALYAPICHAPQALGMLVTRLFGAGITVQCFAARLANFAVSLFLVYQAIKLIPFKKHIVLFLGLLPVTLSEFASMASDALTIAMSIFYISYILYLKYDENKDKYTKKDITILAISSIIVALCKIVYLPLCLLVFILPKEKFGSLKKKNIATISIFAGSVILNLAWLIYCSRFLVVFNPGVDSAGQVKFILTHPIKYLLILFRTMNVYNQILIVGLVGEGLGAYCVQASVLYIYPCIILITSLFFVKEEEENVKFDLFTRIACFVIFAAIVVLIYTSLYVQWTPLENNLILGVQARYFLPILLLTAIFFSNNKLIIKGKIDNRYLVLFLLFMNLNVITSTIFTYMYGTLIDYYIK